MFLKSEGSFCRLRQNDMLQAMCFECCVFGSERVESFEQLGEKAPMDPLYEISVKKLRNAVDFADREFRSVSWTNNNSCITANHHLGKSERKAYFHRFLQIF